MAQPSGVHETGGSPPGAPARDCATPPSGAVRFSFDANGNQTAGGANGGSYTYNSADQTTSLRPNSLFSPIPATYRGPGQSDRSSIGASVEVSSVLGLGVSAAKLFGRDNGGRLVSEHTTSDDYYFLLDGLGSVVALTNAAGQMTFCYDFAPYGDSQSKACAGAPYGTPPSPWGFASTQYDVAQRLYKMGERYYDPNIGRWTQQDPVDQTGDQRQGNRYGYAGGDPINVIDPFGTKNLTAGGGCGIGATVTQDTTGRRAGKTRFGGVQVGASYPGCAASAIAFTGNADKDKSVGVTLCGGICVAADSDKGVGFGLGVGIEVSLGGIL